jgi:hypothetical protein
MSRSIRFGITILMLLSGCSTIAHRLDEGAQAMRNYTEPSPSSPHALVRVSSDSQVIFEPATTCVTSGQAASGVALVGGGWYVGAKGYPGQKREVPGVAPAGLVSAEMRVDAGSALAVSYNTSWSDSIRQYQCVLSRKFSPEPGASYQLVARRSGERCQMAV